MANVLALHRDGDFWKIALIGFKNKKPEIAMVKSLKAEERPLTALNSLLHKKSYVLATALDAEHWIFRKLDLALKGWKNILATLPFQVEDLIPYPKEQMILLPSLEEETTQGSKIQLIATKRELLQDHISAFHGSGFDPHAVTTTVHALKRWARYCMPNLSSLFLVYAHKERGFVAYIHKNELVEFKTFGFEKQGQWIRVKEYMLSLSSDAETIPWVAAGHTIYLEKEKLPWQRIDPKLVEYAMPIGIGLEILDEGVQLRKGELKPAALQQKESKLLKSSLLFLLISFLLLGPLGHFLLHEKEQALHLRIRKSMEKIGMSAKEAAPPDDLLDQLLAQTKELEKDKQFGPHSPIVTWFMQQISLITQGIERGKLPLISTLEYGLKKNGRPHLDIEWHCADQETARLLKKRLQEIDGLQLAKWKEQEQIYTISLEKL